MSSTSSAPASSSSLPPDNDAQTWVYPPPGSRVPPLAVTGNIGPVHLYDKMILQWTPSTKPNDITLSCFSQSGRMYRVLYECCALVITNRVSHAEDTYWIVAKNQGQPLTYEFNSQAYQSNSSDLIYCHMYFIPSSYGNTIVWQFLNTQGDEIKTWHGLSAPSSVSTTITSAQETSSTGTITSTSALSTSKTSPSSSASSTAASSGGLSTGASAGIGVGVAVGVLALVGALIFFFWRKRSNKKKTEAANPPPNYQSPEYQSAQPHYQEPQYSQPGTGYGQAPAPWQQPPPMQDVGAGYGGAPQHYQVPTSELSASNSTRQKPR